MKKDKYRLFHRSMEAEVELDTHEAIRILAKNAINYDGPGECGYDPMNQSAKQYAHSLLYQVDSHDIYIFVNKSWMLEKVMG